MISKEEQKFRKIFAIICIILGLALIIVGIIIFSLDPYWDSHYVNIGSATFGADFYTDTYNALERIVANTGTTAGHTMEMFTILKIFCGSFSVVAGILLMLKNIGILKFSENESEKTVSVMNTQVPGNTETKKCICGNCGAPIEEGNCCPVCGNSVKKYVYE